MCTHTTSLHAPLSSEALPRVRLGGVSRQKSQADQFLTSGIIYVIKNSRPLEIPRKTS